VSDCVMPCVCVCVCVYLYSLLGRVMKLRSQNSDKHRGSPAAWFNEPGQLLLELVHTFNRMSGVIHWRH